MTTTPTPTKPDRKRVIAKAQRFFDAYHVLAQNAQHRCNVSRWVILAQWAVETGWGTSHLAEEHNLAGIRFYGRPGQRQVGGEPGVIGTGFSAYRSVREFVDDYVHVMNLPYYRKVRVLWHPVDNASGVIIPQCRALGESPYDAGHYRAKTSEDGHALIAAWKLLEPIAYNLHRKGPNA